MPRLGPIGLAVLVVLLAATVESGEIRYWVDEDGVTHQTRCHLKAFEKKTFAPPSPAMATTGASEPVTSGTDNPAFPRPPPPT